MDLTKNIIVKICQERRELLCKWVAMYEIEIYRQSLGVLVRKFRDNGGNCFIAQLLRRHKSVIPANYLELIVP